MCPFAQARHHSGSWLHSRELEKGREWPTTLRVRRWPCFHSWAWLPQNNFQNSWKWQELQRQAGVAKVCRACWWGKKTTGELRFCNKEMILGCQAFRGRNAEGRQFKRLCTFVSFPWRHDGSGNSNLTELLGRWSAVWENWFVKFRNLGKIWRALFNRPLWVLAIFYASKKSEVPQKHK